MNKLERELISNFSGIPFSCTKCGEENITSNHMILKYFNMKHFYICDYRYSMEQMYTVVADVENYKKFVPFCKKSTVRSRGSEHMRADLVIGFPPIQESYTSYITIHKPYLVKAVCMEGKLFNHLLTEWKFSPGLEGNLQSCVIDFLVSFEFHSLLHSNLAHVFFSEVVRQMEDAFLREAANRFGKASVKTQKLGIISVNS